MISIIISSYKDKLFIQISENIKRTIGDISYEIIRMYNPGVMGLCAAYNRGGKMAKFPYLVFAHEDILFHTLDWGQIILDVFKSDAKIGLVGCAGGNYKSLLPIGWAVGVKYSSTFMIGSHYGVSHLSKNYKGAARSVKLDNNKSIPDSFQELALVNEEVLMLDGMFLVTKKTVYQHIPFDESTFEGFHGYDLDYSLQIGQLYKVVVNHNILVEHFSLGNFDKKWIAEMKKFNIKWKRVLPYSLQPLTGSQKKQLEFLCFEIFLRIHKYNKLGVIHAFKPLLERSYISRIGVFNWILLWTKLVQKTLSHFLIKSTLQLFSK